MTVTDFISGCHQNAQEALCSVLISKPMSGMDKTNMALETEHFGGLCHV